MIKIYTGDDRVRAKREIAKFLGTDYEVIEGANLTTNDLLSIFRGTSLFATKRQILIRDLSTNKPVFEKLPDYLDTMHDVALQESVLDKRTVTYKTLVKAKVEINDYKIPEKFNYNALTAVYHTAKNDGKKAISMLEKIKSTSEAMQFLGIMVSEASKDFSRNQGTKEKKALKGLSELDIKLKTTSVDPWLLIEGFLLRLASL